MPERRRSERRPWPLRRRLTIAVASATALVLAATGVLVFGQFRQGLEARADTEPLERTDALRGLATSVPPERPTAGALLSADFCRATPQRSMAPAWHRDPRRGRAVDGRRHGVRRGLPGCEPAGHRRVGDVPAAARRRVAAPVLMLTARARSRTASPGWTRLPPGLPAQRDVDAGVQDVDGRAQLVAAS